MVAKMQSRRRRQAQVASFAAWQGGAQRSKRAAVVADNGYERRQRQVVASATAAWADVAQVSHVHVLRLHLHSEACGVLRVVNAAVLCPHPHRSTMSTTFRGESLSGPCEVVVVKCTVIRTKHFATWHCCSLKR